MQLQLLPLIIAAGFTAGFINTLAGSGSLVTLPLLIFMGLPATIANGTNRVAIVLQNIVGAGSFRQQRALDLRGALILSMPAIVGSIFGAQIAANIDELTMRRAIGLLMIAMLVVVIIEPGRWLRGSIHELQGLPKLWQVLLLLVVGAYGGFIQAGVGIFLLSALVLGIGYDLVRANAVKVAMVLVFTTAALIVFIRNDQVIWHVGLVLGIGNMLGAWVASRVAVRRGAVWVRRLLIVIVAGSAGELLGVYDWLASLL